MAMPNMGQMVARTKALEAKIAELEARYRPGPDQADVRSFAEALVVAAVTNMGPQVLTPMYISAGESTPPQVVQHIQQALECVEMGVEAWRSSTTAGPPPVEDPTPAVAPPSAAPKLPDPLPGVDLEDDEPDRVPDTAGVQVGGDLGPLP